MANSGLNNIKDFEILWAGQKYLVTPTGITLLWDVDDIMKIDISGRIMGTVKISSGDVNAIIDATNYLAEEAVYATDSVTKCADSLAYTELSCPYCRSEWHESKFHPGACIQCGAPRRINAAK